jgi:hypothetical protein
MTTTDAAPGPTLRGLLDGLPLSVESLIDGDAGATSASALASRLLARASAGDGAALDLVPEVARRLLTLGVLIRPDEPDDDPLLNPLLDRVDPECRHPGLSLVRAVTAAETERSALLAAIVSRRLEFLTADPGWPKCGLDWLTPLLYDTPCQCLLVTALAAGAPRQAPLLERLWRNLLLLFQVTSPDEDSGGRWPDGPLPACCALGLALSRPGDPAVLAELKATTGWEGWFDESLWPTRHPGKDLPALQELLTERALLLLTLPDRKLWRYERIKRLLPAWPPLATFCVDSPAQTT